jgi:hypothetical protein
VTSRGTDAPRLPVGYPEIESVALQAEDSRLHGGLEFRRKQGWAHDSVLNWRSSDDRATWDLDVLQSGRYEITLMVGCGPEDVGGTVRITAGGRLAEAHIHKAHDPMPVKQRAHDRVAVWTSGPVPIMTWIPVAFEAILLEKGPAQLVVRRTDLPTDSRFELKEARVRYVEPPLSTK